MTSLDSKDGAGKTAMGNLRRAMISETCNISNDIDEMRSDLEIVDLCDR
ncbi:23742_t:CDS:2, partial [Gigaspora rosea]